MVLVTTKNSNILQDLDTLHLFARVVSEYCRSNEEREIARQSFDLLLVFDEIVSMGYRENVNLGQIRTISAMESHEERIQAEIERNKEKEAKEELKRKAKMMDMQKKEMQKKGYSSGSSGFGPGSGRSSFVNSQSGSFGGNNDSSSNNTNGSSIQSSESQFGAHSSFNSFKPASQSSNAIPPSNAGRGGMKLGGGGGQRHSGVLESINAYEGIKETSAPILSSTNPSSDVSGAVRPVSNLKQESVHVAIEEKVSATFSREGGLQGVEINGSMMLKVNDANTARVKLNISQQSSNPALKFMTHPKIDKGVWESQSVLILRDPSRPYPVGQPLGILRWKLSSKDESSVPLIVNCWPSPTGSGSTDVNIEYELQDTTIQLHNVTVIIPYPGDAPPKVGDISGSYSIDRQKRIIQWTIDVIDKSNASGLLEFTVQSEDLNSFYPINIYFTATQLLNGIVVSGADLIDGGQAQMSIEKTLLTESYQVV